MMYCRALALYPTLNYDMESPCRPLRLLHSPVSSDSLSSKNDHFES